MPEGVASPRDRIMDIINEKQDSFWFDDADLLYDVLAGIFLGAAEQRFIDEKEMLAYLDWQKEHMRRLVSSAYTDASIKKMKDMGNKKDLK